MDCGVIGNKNFQSCFKVKLFVSAVPKYQPKYQVRKKIAKKKKKSLKITKNTSKDNNDFGWGSFYIFSLYLILFPINFYQDCLQRSSRGYRFSKRLVQLNTFKSFPMQLSGHHNIPLLSFVLCHQL